jgi:hypothetical protein
MDEEKRTVFEVDFAKIRQSYRLAHPGTYWGATDVQILEWLKGRVESITGATVEVELEIIEDGSAED